MMKRLFFLYALLALVGCTHDEIEKSQSCTSDEYYATFEGGDSRTYVDSQIRMRWTAEDKITLFKKNTYNRTFMFTGKTGANAGGFKQTSVDDEYWFGYDVANSYAVYPHSPDNELDESDLFLTVNMPSEQTYAENTFGLNANTMVAVSDNNQLVFKNVGSYLRVRLYGNNTAISSVTLTTKGSEAIAGSAKVTPALDGNPFCEMTGNGKSIRLVCPNPITISEDSNSPTVFWIVVPPVTLASGFTVTVENSEGYTQSYEVDKSFTFERNKYYTLTKEVKITAIPYLTFTADEEQTFSMTKAVETLQYSVNGGEWTDLGTSTVTFGGSNGELRLRGKSLTGTAKSSLDYSTVKFGNSVSVACSGDIRTLVDYENFKTVDTSEARFCYLFNDCWYLTSAPELPATTLADYCYSSMFEGCKSLVEAPELPATTLASFCYNDMFSGCTSLVEAPELPATTLASYCYYMMFRRCTSLISAPDLPATTLAECCYLDMFYYCSSLIDAPDLPATTLAYGCYSNMFSYCTSLTSAPELPATILAEYCYESMFSECYSLTSAPELSATTLAESCYKSMFSGCSSLTSAPDLPATTLAESCYESMFSGCSILTSAPELSATTLVKNCYYNMFRNCSTLTNAPDLPATTLAEWCYCAMFSGCSSLTSAPILPATTLASYCYANMFFGCSNLNQVTMLATDISASDCLSGWLYGVSSTGVFTKASTMTSLPSGMSGIPTGWTIVNKD